jgi:hypothetical protein
VSDGPEVDEPERGARGLSVLVWALPGGAWALAAAVGGAVLQARGERGETAGGVLDRLLALAHGTGGGR